MSKHIIELAGNRYGKLLVISFHHSIKNKFYWLCKCDCGKEKIVRSDQLKTKHCPLQDCGCIAKNLPGNQSHSWKGFGDIPGLFWSNIKNGARNRGIKFAISIEKAWEIFLIQNKKCILSGIDLHFNSRDHLFDGNASLDRIDSNIGYILENIQWVDKRINLMKHYLPEEEFLNLCVKIVKYKKL